MNCPRCKGFMAKEHCPRYGRLLWADVTTSWCCVNCGRLHDPVMEQNRVARHETVSSVKPEYGHEERSPVCGRGICQHRGLR
jgi:hypothetical protein